MTGGSYRWQVKTCTRMENFLSSNGRLYPGVMPYYVLRLTPGQFYAASRVCAAERRVNL